MCLGATVQPVGPPPPWLRHCPHLPSPCGPLLGLSSRLCLGGWGEEVLALGRPPPPKKTPLRHRGLRLGSCPRREGTGTLTAPSGRQACTDRPW